MERAYRGAIFDVDGVLVDTPHERAWRDTLDALMAADWSAIRPQTSWASGALTPEVYQRLVSGKPRLSGARAALEYFGVPGDERVLEYADRKQATVVRLIEAGEFAAYPDALRFIVAMKDAGLAVAAASSSKNAGLFLRKIRLDTFLAEQGISSPSVSPGMSLCDIFDVDVSGRDFAQGKPHPEMFLTAAAELGVEPERSIVLEDASSGVAAACAGGMAAIGIARFDDAALLEAAGADIVVESLDEVDLDALAAGRLAVRRRPPPRPEES